MRQPTVFPQTPSLTLFFLPFLSLSSSPLSLSLSLFLSLSLSLSFFLALSLSSSLLSSLSHSLLSLSFFLSHSLSPFREKPAARAKYSDPGAVTHPNYPRSTLLHFFIFITRRLMK
uniref:Uncharacterized protein n=1 Tax=Cacopsylla melanoneura TaxID=428564 RepID=A0A8D8Q7N9_9HEMI